MSSVLGAPTRLTSATFYDPTNTTAVDPASVTVSITDPTGTPVVGSPFAAVKDSVGNYHYDFTPTTLSGVYQFAFIGSGANASTQRTDVFTVVPAASGALISLADAIEQLNKAATSPNPKSTDNSEILNYIASASQVVASVCGYTTPVQFSDFTDVGWGSLTPTGAYASGYVPIILNRLPILSVQSVVPQFYNAAPADISKIVIDAEAGVVWLPTTALFLGPCLVTYTAGRASMPPNVLQNLQNACRIIVQHLWETQRGPAGNPRPAGDETVMLPGIGYAIPARAVELMQASPYHAAPGFA